MNVSVIFATYNRSDVIREVLERWKKVDKATKYTYEIICSDDASSDNTVDIIREYEGVLPITILKNEHGGASRARNAALKIAKGEIVIFTGDDIFPNDDFINGHYENYLKFGDNVGTLGRIEWHPDIKMNHLMYHITNVGCEQFGFAGLPPYSRVDFRHFYTSNISVSKKMLDKQSKYFDLTFDRYGFEDIELGYRLCKDGMSFYYDPSIEAFHHHVYDDVDKFCNRQMSAGNQLVVFAGIHEELKKNSIMGIENFVNAIESFINNCDYLISERGKEILAYTNELKERTRQIEQMIEKEDSWELRAECSAIYRYIFQFYMYLGWALRLVENNKVDQSILAEAIFHFMYPGDIYMFWSGKKCEYFVEASERRVENMLHVSIEFEEREAYGIRLDPHNNQCVVKNLSAYAVLPNGRKKKLKIVFSNGEGDSRLDYSSQEDPQVHFKGLGKKKVRYAFEMDVYPRGSVRDEIAHRIMEEKACRRDYNIAVKQPQKAAIFINNKTEKDLQSVIDEYKMISWLIFRDDVRILVEPIDFDFSSNYNYDITDKPIGNEEFIKVLHTLLDGKCCELDLNEYGNIYLRFLEGK